MKLTKLFAIAAVLPASLVVVSGGPTQASSECPEARMDAGRMSVDQEDLPEGTDVVECGLVGAEVESADGALAIQIPPAGGWVTMSTLSVSGTGGELWVVVDDAGEVSYDAVSTLDEGGGEERGDAPEACDDAEYNLLSTGHVLSGEEWKINKSTIPSYLNVNGAVAAIRDGIDAWPDLYNDCGTVDNISVYADYGGDTTDGTAIFVKADGTPDCRANGTNNNDSVSVIAFGSTPGLAGGTCRYYLPSGSGYFTAGADIKFNSTSGYFTTTPGSGCTTQLDLESVATHEGGHWWGLDHVSYASHPRLTMRSAAGSAFTCKTVMRTLGKGDILGMQDIY